MGHDPNQPTGEFSRKEESTGLSTSRADFATSLPRRLESVLGAITSLEQQLDHAGRRDNLLRRIHALSASAKVLGFAAAADVLSRAEQRLRTSQVETLLDDIALVRKHLADLPAMVHRGTYSIAPPHGLPPQSVPRSSPPASVVITGPFSVLLFGTDNLRRSLLEALPAQSDLEITCSTDPDELRQLAAALGPDALLLDTTQGSVTLLVDELTHSAETAGVPIVALNVPEDATQALVELGVRTALSSRATEQQILRALNQARKPLEQRAASIPPFGELSLDELAERIAKEVRLGLVETASNDAQNARISLGDGTLVRAALWSALSQIREHLVEQSDGKIRFEQGPDGSFPLAPGSDHVSRGAGTILDPVDLTGRRILVADDDPAVAWLVGGTLRAAGAVVTEAHDGTRALELAYRIWPELVVSDILMPGLDGFALCHALKRDVLLRDVPVVLLSWKEDLLFRLRDLGSDADGYLRKEATASTIVRRVQELLQPRRALERRLIKNLCAKSGRTFEVRGRLDAMTVRQLLEIATSLDKPVRIALRDSRALYDLRLREGSLKAVTRTRHDGTVERGDVVLGALIAVTAGRFSVTSDNESYEPDFETTLAELLRPAALRARAAQRVLSGLSLGLVDRLVLEPDAFADDLSLLPESLRPIADQLVRGTPPRQLLASGVASVHLLESLLADVARRGAVRSISSALGEDLLAQEMQALTATPPVVPPKPAPAPTPLFTFQLSPSPPETLERSTVAPSIAPRANTSVEWGKASNAPGPNPDTWGIPSGTLAGVGKEPPVLPLTTSIPVSNPPPTDDVDWAMELSWDETPLPAAPPAAPVSESPTSKALNSAGAFMRPTLATLNRRPQTETPDLANAVVKAVSQATPLPIEASAHAEAPSVAESSLANQPEASNEPFQHAPAKTPDDATQPFTSETSSAEPPAAKLAASPEESRDTKTNDATKAPALSTLLGTAPALAITGTPAAAASTTTTAAFATIASVATATAATTSAAIGPVPLAATTSATTAAASPGVPQAHPTPIKSTAASRDPSPHPLHPVNVSPNDMAQTEAATTPKPNTAVASAVQADFVRAPADTLPSTQSPIVASEQSEETQTAHPVSPSPKVLRTETTSALSPPQPLALGATPSPLHCAPVLQIGASPAAPGVAAAVTALGKSPKPPLVSAQASTPGLPRTSPGLDASKSGNAETLGISPKPEAVDHPPPQLTPALPAVQKPPRPAEEPQIHVRREYDSDPVFPLVSAAPPAVEIQPAIEVGDFAIKPEAPRDTQAVPQSPPPRDRDTLRSPGDSTPVPQDEPVSTGKPATPPEPALPREPEHEKPAETAVAQSTSPVAAGPTASPKKPESAPSTRPRTSSAPPPSVNPPSVSWVQAVGLAFLAGAVTFAITVPVARWWRDRPSQPTHTTVEDPQSASAALPTPTEAKPDESPHLPAAVASGQPDAAIETIPTPNDVSLAPGQALIEIVTAGGHAIFVDDSFVGRGPIRVVTVTPGKHQVRTRLNGVERRDNVEVGAGRSVRLSLEQTWK